MYGSVMFLLSAAGLVFFPIAYHFTSSGLWRYSRAGRALMAFMGVLAMVMVLGLWSLIFGPLPQLRAVVWTAVAAVTWWQVWTLFAVRLRPSRYTGADQDLRE